MTEGIQVYQARVQALLWRGQCFAAMAGVGAAAPMQHGALEGGGKREPGGVGAV